MWARQAGHAGTGGERRPTGRAQGAGSPHSTHALRGREGTRGRREGGRVGERRRRGATLGPGESGRPHMLTNPHGERCESDPRGNLSQGGAGQDREVNQTLGEGTMNRIAGLND
eukprot:scaffold211013_cov39-Tisochrysis_lutea.AAC.1